MNTSSRKRSTVLWLLALAAVAVAIGGWMHFRNAHAGGHDHGDHGAAILTLDHGKRWETDQPLRTGMQRIRDAVEPAVQAHRRGELTPQGAEKTAVAINENVQYLVENCKLSPQADAVLHVFITDLIRGSAMLKNDPAAGAGIPLLVDALGKYPEYFNHPAWKPLVVPPGS